MRLERQDSPDPAFRTALMAGLDGHNAASTGLDDRGVSLSVLLRRADGAVDGGAVGYVWYGWLVVEMVYLPPALRSQGVGRQVLRALENAAMAHGAHASWLKTISFQAPGFYERLGYRRFGVLDGRPQGHGTVFLAKTALQASATPLTVEGRAGAGARQVLSDGLDAFNEDVTGRNVAHTVAVAVEADTPAGLWSEVGQDWMFLDSFFLPQAIRRTGIGRRVLALAEEIAREHGCRGVWLDTFSFQGRPFYEACGYRAFGQLDNYPTGHKRYFLQKHFA